MFLFFTVPFQCLDFGGGRVVISDTAELFPLPGGGGLVS